MFSYDFSRLPFISMTGRVNEKAGWSHNGRSMSVNLLVVFLDGECRFEIDGAEDIFCPGDVALIPRGTPYRPHTDTSCEYVFFHFDGEFSPVDAADAAALTFREIPHDKPFYGVKENESDKLLFDCKVTLGDARRDVELLLRKCTDTQLGYSSKLQILLSLQFSEMMFHISKAFCAQVQTADRTPAAVARILGYIRENYRQNLSLDSICAHVGMSKQYCMRLFKAHTGMTISAYILDLRMRHAAYLLRYTYMNVSETAEYLGFSGTSYFSRVFKAYYGVSPVHYFE